MRIFVHDYAGHPFQVQLSRTLAQRGHDVVHAYSSTFLTPHGALARREDDPARFEPSPIPLDQPVDKRARSLLRLYRRRQAEREYGRRLSERILSFRPDVVLAANTPLDALRVAQPVCRNNDIPVVNWLQDIFSIGIDRLLRRWLPVVGTVAGRRYLSIERHILGNAAAVVVITEDFRSILTDWKIADSAIHTIENWAPLEEMPVRPKENEWALSHGLADRRVILYAGTLGMKHNPGLLATLARELQREDPEARLVVVSEGEGADWLRQRKREENIKTLKLLPFQPFEDLPNVHGTADVLTAILEPDAGVFSVPSKVLSYLCSARPLLLAVPDENLAASIVRREEAGVVIPPDATQSFAVEGVRLLADSERREAMARRGRSYAERTFDIDEITNQFEQILVDVVEGQS